MARYIDADAFETFGYAVDGGNDDFKDGFDEGVQFALECIDEQPTADVRENVKGEWKMINEQLAKCSVCGGYESTNGKDMTGKGVIFKTQKKYCPHCGARMVEE